MPLSFPKCGQNRGAASMRRLPLSTTKSAIVQLGDRTRGLCPLVGGAAVLAAWGEPARPGFPLGETGKGLPGCRRLSVLFRRSLSAFLAIADSPCFHSHSLWSRLLRCQLVFSISNGCCPLSASNWSLSVSERLGSRRTLAVTRTRRFASEPQILQATFFFAADAWLFRSGS
jgi:hypothetical protein